MLNADISRLLGELWRKISLAEKRPFLEREKLERKIYKAKVEAFKNNEKLANSFKSPTAAMKKARDTRKKEAREPRLVFSASCTREESHCDQKGEYSETRVLIITHFVSNFAILHAKNPWKVLWYLIPGSRKDLLAPMKQQLPTFLSKGLPKGATHLMRRLPKGLPKGATHLMRRLLEKSNRPHTMNLTQAIIGHQCTITNVRSVVENIHTQGHLECMAMA